MQFQPNQIECGGLFNRNIVGILQLVLNNTLYEVYSALIFWREKHPILNLLALTLRLHMVGAI